MYQHSGQFASFGGGTRAYGLLYLFIGGKFFSYNVYWVQVSTSGNNSTYQIKYRACDSIRVCTIQPPGTFHTATTNWQIGNPVAANGNVYWTEHDTSTFNNNTGDVKRKGQSDPNGTAATIATNQAGIDSRLFVANGLLYFARRSAGIYTLALDASAIMRELSADAMEVTQAIQNLANAAPLAAHKTTYVRAYGKQLSGPNTPNVEAWLEGTINGLALPGSPLQPANGVRALTNGGSYRSRPPQ